MKMLRVVTLCSVLCSVYAQTSVAADEYDVLVCTFSERARAFAGTKYDKYITEDELEKKPCTSDCTWVFEMEILDATPGTYNFSDVLPAHRGGGCKAPSRLTVSRSDGSATFFTISGFDNEGCVAMGGWQYSGGKCVKETRKRAL